MDDLAIRFGQKVRSVRKVKGVSQEQLALMCGIDRSYMSRIERGIVSVTLEKVYLIADLLDCGLLDILPEQIPSSSAKMKRSRKRSKA